MVSPILDDKKARRLSQNYAQGQGAASSAPGKQFPGAYSPMPSPKGSPRPRSHSINSGDELKTLDVTAFFTKLCGTQPERTGLELSPNKHHLEQLKVEYRGHGQLDYSKTDKKTAELGRILYPADVDASVLAVPLLKSKLFPSGFFEHVEKQEGYELKVSHQERRASSVLKVNATLKYVTPEEYEKLRAQSEQDAVAAEAPKMCSGKDLASRLNIPSGRPSSPNQKRLAEVKEGLPPSEGRRRSGTPFPRSSSPLLSSTSAAATAEGCVDEKVTGSQ